MKSGVSKTLTNGGDDMGSQSLHGLRARHENQMTSTVVSPPMNCNSGRWSKLEHCRFLEALKLYGKNWKKV
jgi:hypothetical protein